MSEKPSTRLAQSVITKLSSHSVIEPNTYELDAVERRMIIWHRKNWCGYMEDLAKILPSSTLKLISK